MKQVETTWFQFGREKRLAIATCVETASTLGPWRDVEQIVPRGVRRLTAN